MEKIKEFLKNKSIGYFIVAGDAVLALLLAIIYFITYKGAMANNAAANVPETIGIFLIAGVLVEAAVLVVPQYRFIHIAGVVMYSLALFKEIILIPNLIADWVNKVFYQGGNLGTNVFYLVTLLIIVIAAIVAAYLGFYKNDEEAKEEMKIKGLDLPKIIKVSACGVVVLGAVLSSSLIANIMQNNMSLEATEVETFEPEITGSFNPFTEDLIALCAKKREDYGFTPSKVLISEKKTYDFKNAELKKVPATGTRSGHHLVYAFEGAYAEGYQGDYGETYGYLYLWDDGMFGGKINDTTVRGYWYNHSLKAKRGVKDCLNMVSNVKNYDSIITQDASGFYEKNAYAYLGFSWGTRSMILNGYKYYPEVAVAIDPSGTGTEFFVGDSFDMDSWVCNRILANCKYSAVFKSSDVTWTKPSGMVDANNVFTKAGEFTIEAKYNNMKASVKVNVTDPNATPAA